MLEIANKIVKYFRTNIGFYVTLNNRDDIIKTLIKSLGGRYYFYDQKRWGKYYFKYEKTTLEIVKKAVEDAGYEFVDRIEYIKAKEKGTSRITEEERNELLKIKFAHSYNASAHRCYSSQLFLMMYTYMKMIGRLDKNFKGRYFYQTNKTERRIGLYKCCPIDSFGEFNAIARFGLNNNLLVHTHNAEGNKIFKFTDFTEETLLKIVEESNKKHFHCYKSLKLDSYERIDVNKPWVRFCTICGKDITERHKRAKYCFECAKKKQRWLTLERQNRIQRAIKDFKEGRITRNQLYYARNIGYFQHMNKKYRKEHPEKCKKLTEEYRKAHPEKEKIWSANYRENHKEVVVLCILKCRGCNEIFHTEDAKKRYCTNKCRTKNRNDGRKEYKQKWREERRTKGLKVS